MSTVLFLSGVAAATWWLTGRFRRFAETRNLLDVPNARSSHAVPTPRGGGVAIVVVSVLAFVLMPLLTGTTIPWGLCGAGVLVALVGFADDRRHVAPLVRLAGHLVACVWIVCWLNGVPPISLFGWWVAPTWLAYALAVVYLAWLLNLTNFMDGIDGIAALETIVVSVLGVVLHGIALPAEPVWITPLALAAATVGFLVWNWPPARIFMGDGGSGFLGLMLGAFSLQAAWASPNLLWAWLILLGVFVVDATVTLVRRLGRGERVHEAHRSHAYQHAALSCRAHLPVTLGVGVINLCWLFPVAVLVASGGLEGATGLIVAYAPLVAVAVSLRAGVPGRI